MFNYPAPFTHFVRKLPTPPQGGSPLAALAQRAEPALRAGSARTRRRRRRRLVSPAPAGRGSGGEGQYYITLQNHLKNNYWISRQKYLLNKMQDSVDNKKVAGAVGFEPTTDGFGDHYSTN